MHLHTGLHFLCYVRFHRILSYTQACISCVMWGFTEYYVTHRPAFPVLFEVSLNILLHTGLHFLCYVRFHRILSYTQACISCVMWGFTEYYVTHRPAFPVLCEVSLNRLFPLWYWKTYFIRYGVEQSNLLLMLIQLFVKFRANVFVNFVVLPMPCIIVVSTVSTDSVIVRPKREDSRWFFHICSR
jgi:hypothetical protein